jgi:hypothetical protein
VRRRPRTGGIGRGAGMPARELSLPPGGSLPRENGSRPSRGKRLGPVAVLIGPATFTSAADNAIELWRGLDAKLVGEPTGGSPRSSGEVMTFTLPHAGLFVRYTTKLEGPGLDLATPRSSRTSASPIPSRMPAPAGTRSSCGPCRSSAAGPGMSLNR